MSSDSFKNNATKNFPLQIIYIYIYKYMDVNNGNRYDSMKKIEKQSIPELMNL